MCSEPALFHIELTALILQFFLYSSTVMTVLIWLQQTIFLTKIHQQTSLLSFSTCILSLVQECTCSFYFCCFLKFLLASVFSLDIGQCEVFLHHSRVYVFFYNSNQSFNDRGSFPFGFIY